MNRSLPICLSLFPDCKSININPEVQAEKAPTIENQNVFNEKSTKATTSVIAFNKLDKLTLNLRETMEWLTGYVIFFIKP